MGVSCIFCIKNNDDDTNISFIFYDARRVSTGPENDFYMGEVLGSGQFAVVKKCISKENGQSYALKIIEKKKIFST